MKAAVFVLAVVALAAPFSATGERVGREKTTATVLAVQSSREQDYLVRVDANSLRPVSKRLPLGGHAFGWSFSPDGRRLALGVDQAHGVRIVDLRRMKRVATIATWTRWIHALAWVAPRRIIGWEGAGLFVLDPVARKRLPSPQSPGNVLIAQHAGDRLVLLTVPPLESGPAVVAVIRGDGALRSARLDRIRASGSMRDDIDELHRPALVLDPAGRAYVVGTAESEPVAEIELERLNVTYHEPGQERSLMTRFWNWFEPAAEAKEPLAGSFRTGAWLGDGKIAVWGSDSVRAAQDRVQTTPAGLSVIDTKDWTRRTIDPEAWHAAFAGGTLLAAHQRGGLTGFTTEGDRRYHLFDHDRSAVEATFGSRAFVVVDRKPVHVIDAVTGRILGTRRTMPRLLHRGFYSR